MKKSEKYADHAYALLRIMSGFMFFFHGCQKILGIYTEHRPPAWTQIWVGGLIELVGGAMVMLGWNTRLAAFICSGQMAVAYFQFHWKFQLGADFFPGVNHGESAVLYCFIFLLIACRGGVKWAINNSD
jgi:putative oxidoreductase